MPKVIMHLQEKIIFQAEKILQDEGPSKLTIRGVAKKCGIGVGTVYNYYPTKDALIAGIVMNRWDKTKEKIVSGISSADSFREGLKCIFDESMSFTVNSRSLWQDTTPAKQLSGYFREQHSKLILEFKALVDDLFIRFPKINDKLSKSYGKDIIEFFIAENIYLCLTNENLNIDMLCDILNLET